MKRKFAGLFLVAVGTILLAKRTVIFKSTNSSTAAPAKSVTTAESSAKSPVAPAAVRIPALTGRALVTSRPPSQVNDLLLPRVRRDLRERASFRELEANEWRVETQLLIDNIRVEDSELVLRPSVHGFEIASGSLPKLPANFPEFPEVDANRTALDVRAQFERQLRKVESAEFVDKSWMISNGQVIACVNVDVFYQGPATFEHDLVCIDAQSGGVARNRSVLRRF
jgi:hypothetical protein